MAPLVGSGIVVIMDIWEHTNNSSGFRKTVWIWSWLNHSQKIQNILIFLKFFFYFYMGHDWEHHLNTHVTSWKVDNNKNAFIMHGWGIPSMEWFPASQSFHKYLGFREKNNYIYKFCCSCVSQFILCTWVDICFCMGCSIAWKWNILQNNHFFCDQWYYVALSHNIGIIHKHGGVFFLLCFQNIWIFENVWAWYANFLYLNQIYWIVMMIMMLIPRKFNCANKTIQKVCEAHLWFRSCVLCI